LCVIGLCIGLCISFVICFGMGQIASASVEAVDVPETSPAKSFAEFRWSRFFMVRIIFAFIVFV